MLTKASRYAELTAAIAALSPALGLAQEDDFDRTPTDCVITTNIDKTEVLDDSTILFHMRGNRIYRNSLPRRCPNLERNDRFSYRTTSNRLCDIDTITVLEQWGGSLQRGFTCSLGAFHPITAEEVEELERIKEQGGGRDAIEAEPVELPPDEAEDAPAEAQSEPDER
jgi:hypothetical protein